MLSFMIGVYFFARVIQPGSGVLGGNCDSASDCASDECCVTNAQLDGKRFLSALGTCQKFGTEGSRCLASSHLSPSSGVYYVCPCASGFKCQGTGFYDVPLGEIGSCRAPSTRVGQTCHSGDNCAIDECCVSDIRPVGRRKRQFNVAHCEKMGVEGSGCYVRQSSGKSNETVFACPCSDGLKCIGSHVIDIPLGEVGTCHH